MYYFINAASEYQTVNILLIVHSQETTSLAMALLFKRKMRLLLPHLKNMVLLEWISSVRLMILEFANLR
jgi:hypothetical protein